MPSIAITGSIGSGKSSVTELLFSQIERSGIPCTSFSADLENRRLLETDHEVKGLIIEKLGKECYDPEGNPDRGEIFRIISSDESRRHYLESILHPRLEAIWKPLAASFGSRKGAWFIAEIPLLYEKDLSWFFDRVAVVACSPGIRKQRLLSLRNLSDEEMERWNSLQLLQEEKISRADHLFWNDGTRFSMECQATQFLSLLSTR
jgi:dephospho-CoA kinase